MTPSNEDINVNEMMAIHTVFSCSAVPAEKMPPQSTTNLSLEGRKSQPFSITMEAQRLGYTNSQPVQNPYSFAAVVDSERSLQYIISVVGYQRPFQAGELTT